MHKYTKMHTCVPLYMFYKQLRINIKILMIISKAGLRDDSYCLLLA